MVLAFTVSGVLLIALLRVLLIVLGRYKDPVMASFQVYGDESRYSPLLSLIFWVYAFIAYHLILWRSADFVAYVLVFLGFFLAYFTWVNRDWVPTYRAQLGMMPRWYARLLDRTSRDERRRIGYLWLRLPLRTRLLYSVNDTLFDHWVDLVLLTLA